MCTHEDTLAWYLGAMSMDDAMSHNELTTIFVSHFMLQKLEHKIFVTEILPPNF